MLELVRLTAWLVGGAVLLTATVFVVLGVRSGPGGLALPLIIFAALMICIAVAEWPWSGRWRRSVAVLVRFVILGLSVLWLSWALFLGRPMRTAFGSEDPVTHYGSTKLTPFNSGVATMVREADRGITEAWLPIVLLLWAAAWPGFRTLHQLSREPAAGQE